MCDVYGQIRHSILGLVLMAVGQREIFTGWEIFMRLSGEDKSLFDSRNVSAYVRELFNSGMMTGYCTTTVDPTLVNGRPKGPVLYFPQPHYIAVRCEKMRAEMYRKEVE